MTSGAQLTPRSRRPGQIAGVSSTEFGLANMIWAAVVVAKGPDYVITPGKVVGVFAGLLVFHGILVSDFFVSPDID